jgi:hypothetical protein
VSRDYCFTSSFLATSGDAQRMRGPRIVHTNGGCVVTPTDACWHAYSNAIVKPDVLCKRVSCTYRLVAINSRTWTANERKKTVVVGMVYGRTVSVAAYFSYLEQQAASKSVIDSAVARPVCLLKLSINSQTHGACEV